MSSLYKLFSVPSTKNVLVIRNAATFQELRSLQKQNNTLRTMYLNGDTNITPTVKEFEAQHLQVMLYCNRLRDIANVRS